MTDTTLRIILIALIVTNLLSIVLLFFMMQRQREAKRILKLQKQSEDRLAYVYRILDGIPLPIYIRDYQGVFVYGNQESKRLMGVHEGKLNGKHLEEIMQDATEEWIHTWLDEDQYVIREEKELSLHPQEVITNSGFTFYGITRKVPVRLDNSGEVYALSVTIDVTDFKLHESKLQMENDNLTLKREESERRLVAMEKLASLGTVVKAIATSISSPIDTSVALVSTLENETENMMNTLMMDEHLHEGLDERVKKVFETSKMLAYNLNKTNQLMDRFKLVANDGDLTMFTNFSLKNSMLSVVNSFKTMHPSINMKVVCADDLMIETYSEGLVQVLNGLIHNAVVHGFENKVEGQVILEAYNYEDKTVIQVKNNGIPISSDVVDVMYEPLFTSKKEEGFEGLGLSIIFTIVLGIMKGDISHKYEEPWTIFEITLSSKS